MTGATADDSDPLIGAVVGDRYRIVERIGAGGMGAVYRAEHTLMHKELAVKVLLPELGAVGEAARRFAREADSASRLSHPHIISVTDFGHTPSGAPFLVMEMLQGEPLSAAIARGPLPRVRALAIMRQVLRALDHAHAAGVVHRDLKPDNIMLCAHGDERDQVKILDFGIAKITAPDGAGDALTQAGVIFGTPEYLSPEQGLGEEVDARADLYAAGVVLFEMLTGRRPFEAADKVRIVSMHLTQPPPRPRSVNPSADVTPSLERVILQALEKDRRNRFASAGAFLAALDEAERAPDTTGSMAVAERPPGRPAAGASTARSSTASTLAATPSARRAPVLLRFVPPRLRPRVFAALVVIVTAGVVLAVRGGRDHGGSHPATAARHPSSHRPPATPAAPAAPAAAPHARSGPAPAADTLVEVANHSQDLDSRRRAVVALEAMGEGERVDRLGLHVLELKKGATCPDRHAAVLALRDLGDPKALPALRAQRSRGGGALAQIAAALEGRSRNDCLEPDLGETIKALEAKLPAGEAAAPAEAAPSSSSRRHRR